MGQSYCIKIRRSASTNIVLYSRFFWLKGSVTLIRAETERYDIVRFSKVTTKSLASVACVAGARKGPKSFRNFRG